MGVVVICPNRILSGYYAREFELRGIESWSFSDVDSAARNTLEGERQVDVVVFDYPGQDTSSANFIDRMKKFAALLGEKPAVYAIVSPDEVCEWDSMFSRQRLVCGDRLQVTPDQVASHVATVQTETPIDDYAPNSRGLALIAKLRSIKAGRSHAGVYHQTVRLIFDYVFEGLLGIGWNEKVLSSEDKRVDIVYSNHAEKGFFSTLLLKTNVLAPYIFVECKNYSKDIDNPVFDQLAGRFGDMRGRFGIISCRSIRKRESVLKKCRSRLDKRKELIIVLEDSDLAILIKFRAGFRYDAIDRHLSRAADEVILD